jgi:uncharacterized membrane protein YtjA (UPF0391 family)
VVNIALLSLSIALIAGMFGFGGLAGTSDGFAKILCALFLVVFLGSLLVGRRARQKA